MVQKMRFCHPWESLGRVVDPGFYRGPVPTVAEFEVTTCALAGTAAAKCVHPQLQPLPRKPERPPGKPRVHWQAAGWDAEQQGLEPSLQSSKLTSQATVAISQSELAI